jgi:hypothetical protein
MPERRLYNSRRRIRRKTASRRPLSVRNVDRRLSLKSLGRSIVARPIRILTGNGY